MRRQKSTRTAFHDDTNPVPYAGRVTRRRSWHLRIGASKSAGTGAPPVPAVAPTPTNTEGRKVDRSETVRLRVGPKEKEGFEQAAELAGLSFSAWARVRLRKAAISELEDADMAVPFIRPQA